MDEYPTTSNHYNMSDQLFVDVPHRPRKLNRRLEDRNDMKQTVLFVPMNSFSTPGTKLSNRMSGCRSDGSSNKAVLHQMSNVRVSDPPFCQMVNVPCVMNTGNTESSSPSSPSQFDTLCTSGQKSNKESAEVTPTISRITRKKLKKEIRSLDNTNHHQLEELSCGLCSIIVPDEKTMMKHSVSHMHLTQLLACWTESVEKTREKLKSKADSESDSCSSDSSGEVPLKKQRVQWNLTNDVVKDQDKVRMNHNTDGNSFSFYSRL